MRLLIAEFHKLFTKKFFVSCFLLFLAANTAILIYTQSSDYNTKTIHENKQMYTEIISELQNKSSNEVSAYLEESSAAVRIATIIKKIDEESDPEMRQIKIDNLEQEKKMNPAAYEHALKIDVSDGEELWNYTLMIDDLKNQCRDQNSFKNGIDEMEQRAKQQSLFSIFSEDGSFSKANIDKTVEDFQSIKSVDPTVGNNYSVTAATSFEITDYFVFAIVFSACIIIFTFERDRNLYCLIRSTKHGRYPLIVAKLFTIGIVSVVTSVIYYVSNIVAASWYTGIGDTSRAIQSVQLFFNCSLRITIAEYLVLWVVSKTLAMLSTAMLLSLIFTSIKNTSTVAIVCTLVFGIEFVLYTAIGRNSWLNHFKYINVFSFVNGNAVFGDYLNLNIFSVPVNTMTIYYIVVPMIFLASLVLTTLIFAKFAQFSKSAVWDRLFDKIRARITGVKGNISIFNAECYKHYKGSLVWVIIVILAYSAYTSLNADLTFNYNNAEDMIYSDYMQILEGVVTPEKEQFIKDEETKISQMYERINSIREDTTIDEYEKTYRLTGLLSSYETKSSAFEQLIEQYDYIKNVGSERHLEPVFVNKLVYIRLLQNPFKEWRFLSMLMLVVIFSASNVFAYEYKKNMLNLIRCTKYGKARLVLTKIFVVLLTVLISYTLIYLPYMIDFVRTFGDTAINSPLIFMPSFSNVNSNITIMQYICVAGAVHILFAFAIAVFVSMLSIVLRNNTSTMIVSAVIVLVPFVVLYGNDKFRLYNAFAEGKQVVVIVVILLISIIITALSLLIIIKIFFPLRRIGHDRVKNKIIKQNI